MLSLPVFLRVFFLRALCCVFLRSLVPAGNQAGAGAGLPGSSRYAPAHGIAVVRKVCPVRIFTAKETAVCAIFSYICRMKITILGPAHPYRGGLASIMEIMARTFQRRGNEVDIKTFTLQYPSLLFPGKSQTVSTPPPAAHLPVRQYGQPFQLGAYRSPDMPRTSRFRADEILDALHGTLFRHLSLIHI